MNRANSFPLNGGYGTSPQGFSLPLKGVQALQQVQQQQAAPVNPLLANTAPSSTNLNFGQGVKGLASGGNFSDGFNDGISGNFEDLVLKDSGIASLDSAATGQNAGLSGQEGFLGDFSLGNVKTGADILSGLYQIYATGQTLKQNDRQLDLSERNLANGEDAYARAAYTRDQARGYSDRRVSFEDSKKV